MVCPPLEVHSPLYEIEASGRPGQVLINPGEHSTRDPEQLDKLPSRWAGPRGGIVNDEIIGVGAPLLINAITNCGDPVPSDAPIGCLLYTSPSPRDY